MVGVVRENPPSRGRAALEPLNLKTNARCSRLSIGMTDARFATRSPFPFIVSTRRRNLAADLLQMAGA